MKGNRNVGCAIMVLIFALGVWAAWAWGQVFPNASAAMAVSSFLPVGAASSLPPNGGFVVVSVDVIGDYWLYALRENKTRSCVLMAANRHRTDTSPSITYVRPDICGSQETK